MKRASAADLLSTFVRRRRRTVHACYELKIIFIEARLLFFVVFFLLNIKFVVSTLRGG